MKVCQYVLLAIIAMRFYSSIYEALGGTSYPLPKPPLGVWGICEAVIHALMWVALLWSCGAFSSIFNN